jgi:hypothetical protein
MYAIFRQDTTYIRGTEVGDTSAWADSGSVPKIKLEYRYIMEVTGRGASDTLMLGRPTGVQYASISDSLDGGVGVWAWKPIKLLGLAPTVEFRITDAEASVRGAKNGKRFRIILVGRLRLP